MQPVHPTLSLVLATIVLCAACSAPTTTAATSPSDDGYGVVAAPPLPVTAPAIAFDPGSDIADLDGSTVATIRDGALVVSTVEGPTSMVAAAGDDGTELRALSADGSLAALFARTSQDQSRISVVSVERPEPPLHVFDLPGLIEPEAFSTDGRVLFVIDHQVATEEGAYRVRPLNLETGQLEDTLGPTKLPFGDDMNGSGRRQVWAPDGSRLYTLYVRQTHHHHAADAGHGDGHGSPGTDGFVHVLDLEEEWAFCLDLPSAFGAGDLANTALAVSPDGESITVADLAAGQVAYASTTELKLTETIDLPPLPASLGAPEEELQIGLVGDLLAIGAGSEIGWFDRTTLEPVGGTAELAKPIFALTNGGDDLLVWSAGTNDGPQILAPPT